MDFEEITITLPPVVKELYEFICTISNQTFIAGGFVFDQYMNYPFKDVDLFVPKKDEQKVLKAIETISHNLHPLTDEYSFLMFNDKGSYEFVYKGITFQLIFHTNDLAILDTFDIRFRECYYRDGKSFMSREALLDIQNKELCVGNVFDAAKTLHRLVRFEAKYGFSISDEQIEKLFYFFKNETYGKSFYAKKYPNTCISEKALRTRYTSILETMDAVVAYSPVKDNLAFGSKKQSRPMSSAVFNALFQKKAKFEQEISYTFPVNPYTVAKEAHEQQLIQYVKQNLTKLLFHFPDRVQFWRKNIENPAYLYGEFREEMKRLGKYNTKEESHSYIRKINEFFYYIDIFIEDSLSSGSTYNFSISTDNSVFSSSELDLNKYLNNDYLFVSTENRTIVFDIQGRKMVKTTMSNSMIYAFSTFFKDMWDSILQPL